VPPDPWPFVWPRGARVPAGWWPADGSWVGIPGGPASTGGSGALRQWLIFGAAGALLLVAAVVVVAGVAAARRRDREWPNVPGGPPPRRRPGQRLPGQGPSALRRPSSGRGAADPRPGPPEGGARG
jgi:hypothetical protein